RYRVSQGSYHERVLTGTPEQAIAMPGTPNQYVIAGATDERVEAAAPLKREGDRAGGECRGINGVGAAPAVDDELVVRLRLTDDDRRGRAGGEDRAIDGADVD